MYGPTTAIVGGLVVNDASSFFATVLISGRKISGLLDPHETVPSDVATVLRADGDIVVPGGVDPHCHIRTTMGSYTTLDGYAEASVAALWGGTTTIVDFAIPTPGQSPMEAVADRLEMARESHCDTALHGCVTTWRDDIPEQLASMAEVGVRTVKLFTTYRDSVMASSDTILRVMRILRDLGGIAYIHAESNALIEYAEKEVEVGGRILAADHSKGRPAYTESASVAEVLSIAEALGAHAYFVHQSTPAAVSLVERARRGGARVYSETCPHYLLLDESRYTSQDPEKYVCCPPLREKSSRDELRRKVTGGDLETVGSDHNCFNVEQKLRYRGDVRRVPNGLPGVELRMPLMFSMADWSQPTELQNMVRLLCANPARLNGIYPQKGVIAPGSDADLVILTKETPQKLKSTALHMASDYSPFEDLEVSARVRTVLSGGTLVLDDGEFDVDGVSGRHLHSARVGNSRIC